MAILDQLIGMALAYYGYDNSGVPEDKLAFKVPEGWVGIDDDRNTYGQHLADVLNDQANPIYKYNEQFNGSGTVENRFAVFINKYTNQIAICIKGSDAWSNWVSDLGNAGASEFAKIQEQLQAALIQLRADYPGYQIIAAGHSLGGAMAQAFGLRNDLDIAVYNSLPIPKGIIDSGYFGDEGFSGRLADFVASGRFLHDVYTANDIATFWFRNTATAYGKYLSSVFEGTDGVAGRAAVMLPGTEMPPLLRIALTVGSLYTAIPAMASAAIDHMMGSLADAAQGLATDPLTGRFIIPDGAATYSEIPASVRRELGSLGNNLSASMPTSVVQSSSSEVLDTYVIKRMDGSLQYVNVYKSGTNAGQVEISQTGNGVTTSVTMNKNDPQSVTISRYENDTLIEQISVDGHDSTVAQRVNGQQVEVSYTDGQVRVRSSRAGVWAS